MLEKLERPIGLGEHGDSVGRRRDGRREQQVHVRVMAPDPMRQGQSVLVAADVHVEQDQGNTTIGLQGSARVGLAEGFYDIVAPLAQVGCRLHAQQEVVLHDHDAISRA